MSKFDVTLIIVCVILICIASLFLNLVYGDHQSLTEPQGQKWYTKAPAREEKPDDLGYSYVNWWLREYWKRNRTATPVIITRPPNTDEPIRTMTFVPTINPYPTPTETEIPYP